MHKAHELIISIWLRELFVQLEVEFYFIIEGLKV